MLPSVTDGTGSPTAAHVGAEPAAMSSGPAGRSYRTTASEHDAGTGESTPRHPRRTHNGQGLHAHDDVPGRIHRRPRRPGRRALRLVRGRRGVRGERQRGHRIRGRRGQRGGAARADRERRSTRLRPASVRYRRRLERQPPERRTGRRGHPHAHPRTPPSGGRGRPSSTESRRRSPRRGRSPATRTSRSPAPTSPSRHSTSAWWTRYASASYRCCSARASPTSPSWTADTCCSRTRSWCRDAAPSTSGTRSVADGRVSGGGTRGPRAALSSPAGRAIDSSVGGFICPAHLRTWLA